MSTPTDKSAKRSGVLLRIALPCLILLAGWLAFSKLSVEIDAEPPPTAEKVTLRTRVEKLEVIDYPVKVRTNAVVQAHNPITLTAEISGTVVGVGPSFEVGAYFKEGDLLVEIDPRDYVNALSIAKSELAASKSAFKLAKLDEERKVRLVEFNAVSRAEVDVASATREQAKADVELAESRVQQAELDLKRTKIFAPFDGRVQSKLVGIGQTASSNAPLGAVFAIDYAEVRLPISGRQRRYVDLPEFPDDESLDVTLRDAINADNETVWHGKIVRTEGVLDQDSRDVFAIARVDDPFGQQSGQPPLRIGQPVEATITGTTLRNVIALPRAAVKQLDKIVLVNQEDRTLRPLNVESLWSDAEHIIVPGSSIPTGTWLATTPMTFTPEGAKVEIIKETTASASIADQSPTGVDEPVAN